MGIPVFDDAVFTELTGLDIIDILDLAEVLATLDALGVAITELVLSEKKLEELILISEHISHEVDIIAAGQEEILNELITIDSDLRIGFSTIDNELSIMHDDIITELKIVDIDIVNELK